MERNELIELARRAQADDAIALDMFKTRALCRGYDMRGGGWIYREGVLAAHGWRELASYVPDEDRYNTLETLLRPVAPVPTYRPISTGTIPDVHIARCNGPALIGRLLCGQLTGGTVGSQAVADAVHEHDIDCLACVDAWVEATRPASYPAVGAVRGLSDCVSH